MKLHQAIALAGSLLITPVLAADAVEQRFHYFPKSLKDAGYQVGPKGITEVRDIQARLHELGYKVRVDGFPGPATEDALRDFQRDRDLPATGELDKDTWVRLWLPTDAPVDLKCKEC